MSRRIVFISKGNEAPSTRYRALAFEKRFRDDGWEVDFCDSSGSLFNKLATLKRCQGADVVVIIRKSFSALFLSLLKKCCKTLVYDFDDAVFTRASGGDDRRRLQRFIRSVKTADIIWAGNSYLAENARRYNSNVTVIPTSVNPERYMAGAEKSTKHFDLVWIGSSSTIRYIREAVPHLRKAAAEIPGLRLKVIANTEIHDDQLEIINIPWSQMTEVPELCNSHAGIAPLPDDPFTRGKCGLKVLQYMAARLPVVSSQAGVNKEMIRSANGLLIDSPEQWSDAIIELAGRPNLREMGEQGRKIVENDYSTDQIYQKMTATLQSI